MDAKKNRLLEFIKYLGIGQNAFERSANITVAHISKVGELSPKLLKKIYEAYPQLNNNWLENGIGEMLHGVQQSSNNSGNIGHIVGNGIVKGNINNGDTSAINNMLKMLEKKDDQVAEMIKQHAEMIKQHAELINLLKKQQS
jgi:hypothetical protein